MHAVLIITAVCLIGCRSLPLDTVHVTYMWWILWRFTVINSLQVLIILMLIISMWMFRALQCEEFQQIVLLWCTLQEAHVAAGAMSIRPSRQEVIDFTVPYMQSGITAVLKDTLQPSLDAVKTPLDLANQSAVSYGCIPGTQTYYYFRNSNGTIINRMWQQMTSADPSVFEMGSQLGIQRVRDSNGSYAFLLENLFAEYLSSQPPCELRVLNGFLNLSKYAFAVKKNSPLLHSLNEILRSLVDGGVVERLKKKWWRGECNVKVKPFKVDDASISVNLESRADEAQDGVEMNSQEKPQEIVWNTSGSNQCHQSLSWMVLLVSFLLVKWMLSCIPACIWCALMHVLIIMTQACSFLCYWLKES